MDVTLVVIDATLAHVSAFTTTGKASTAAKDALSRGGECFFDACESLSGRLYMQTLVPA